MDRFAVEKPTKEEKLMQEKYDFYRIIIIPYPRYTIAAQESLDNKDISRSPQGELIEGIPFTDCINILL